MKKLTLVSLLFAFTLSAQQFTNATVTTHAASRGIASVVRGAGTSYVAWSVPLRAGVQICCYGGNYQKGFDTKNCCGGCALGRWQGFSTNNSRDARGSGVATLVARVEGGELQKVQLFDGACPIRGTGGAVHVIAGVTVDQSLDYLATQVGDSESSVMAAIAQHGSTKVEPLLERFAAKGNDFEVRENAIFWIGMQHSERGFRFLRDLLRNSGEATSLRKKAVFAMSQTEAGGAVGELIRVARHDEKTELRRDALFWLGQKAGEKAASELRRAVDEDPEEDVREHAVFAISQLPRERSVPMLINLVKTHKSAAVREKAMFWLAQTNDPRALALIEEILTK